MKSSEALPRFSIVFPVVCALFMVVAGVSATQVTLPVNSSSSTMTVTLCADPGIGEKCDTDSTSVSGYLVVSLDNNNNPTGIALRNYDLQATSDLSLSLSWGFIIELAGVDATATGLGLSHPTPGPLNPYFAVSGGSFTGVDAPYQARGLANYSGRGLTCNFLNPCSGTINLSSNGPGTIATMPGTVTVNNGVASVHLDITVVQYLDAANPALGTITIHAIVNAAGAVPSGLVPFGSLWHFLDNGSNLGSTWLTGGFDFSSWAFGEAQLGYGDGDEVTTNQFGPDSNNKYITTYYMCSFQGAAPATYTNLVLRLLRDDGAVVHLNGAEVFRSNMPTGAVDYLTRAASSVGGAAENLYFAAYLSPSLLVAGRNVLAVEVHQEAPTSSDVSFDLELQGNFTFSNQPPVVAISNPTNGAVLPSESFSLQAAASDPDGVILRVEFFQDGVKIGESASAPYTVTVPALCPGSYTFTVRAWDNSVASTLSAPATVNVIRPTQVLVAKGSDWKYFANGTDQGTAWRATNFNDTAWAHGRAQLGYGDGDEVTTVGFGPDPNNRYITTYFRHRFVVTNMSSMLGLILRVLRDDGVVIHLNGTEIYRDNMPTGAVTYVTLASGTAGGTDETTNFHSAGLGTNLLVLGTNVIAAEIHQVTTNSSDISFDLELVAGYPNLPPVVAITNLANGAEIPAEMNVLLEAAAWDNDGVPSKVEFYDGTSKIGEAFTPPYQAVWTEAPAGRHTLTAVAYDDCGLSAVSPVVNVNVGIMTMVSTGAVWKYRDNGANLGTAWAVRGYDDASWKSGPAELGYGDSADGRPEATVVTYGSSDTNKYITTYFRRSWLVRDISMISALNLRLLRDDGAVVYLNGTEVFRSNMPLGPVTYLTPASNSVSGAEETTYFETNIPPTYLLNGSNVIAVEVHQVNKTSSDLSFDLELAALVQSGPAPVKVIGSNGTYALRWPSWAVGYRLYRADSLTPPVLWVPLPVTPENDGNWKTLHLAPNPTNGFYRVGW